MLRAAVLHPFLRGIRRFSTSSHPEALGACYVASWQLPRPDLHRSANDDFSGHTMPLFGAGSSKDMVFPSSRMALTLRLWCAQPHPAPVWNTDAAPGFHSSRGALCRRDGASAHFVQTTPMIRQLS
jgi:hypothetical protein